MVNKIAILSFLLVLVSCQDNTENSNNGISATSKSTPKMNALQRKVDNINTNAEDLNVANSLSYRHNDGSIEEVFAYLNQQQQIVKVEEKFKNGKEGDSGVRFFYFEKGKKIMTVERFIDVKKRDGKFLERVSFYDKSGKPFASKERVTLYEEDLEKIEFSAINPYDCSIETAENVLNQKGVFSTTFQGFASDGPIDYLIVGGPGETGFASALAVQYADQTTNYLKSNQERMVDSPLLVEFEKMMDERKLEFQVLTRVEIKK